MARLQDKVIIITGAAQGMGETHARLCLAEGAKVVLTDINAEKGEALAKELGDNALFVKHDVTDEEDWSKVANATQGWHHHTQIYPRHLGCRLPQDSRD